MTNKRPGQLGNASLGIPRRLGHIWIGKQPPPTHWMQSWVDHHPTWEYTVYGNEFLRDEKFSTRIQIDEYLKRGQYAGVADLMRLEILYRFGGLLPGADSVCFRNTEELFVEPTLYTVYENEFARGKLVSPIQAAPPKHPFIKKLVETLSETDPALLDDPWISTGNLFTALMIEAQRPDIVIFPSHYFIPIHFTGLVYQGNGPVYARQMFGTTRAAYTSDGAAKTFYNYLLSIRKRAFRLRRLSAARRLKNRLFESADRSNHET